MADNQVAMNATILLGLIASALITVSYIPQTVHTMRSKHVKGLSLSWLVILIAGSAVYVAYGLMVSSIPVVISSAAGVVLGAIILYHKLKYS